MEILTWNIQAARGVDGVTSIERIAQDIRNLADADIICLQEVLVTVGENQSEQFSQHFPDHTAIFGAAIDRLDTAGRLQFGNLILCRLPVQQIVQHKLPQPAEPMTKHMPRQATEILVQYQGTPLRVITTHLEYFAAQQRAAQIDYLAAHHRESMERCRHPSPEGGEAQFAALPETSLALYCGDFNMTVDSPQYRQMTDPQDDGASAGLIDCWRLINNDRPHDPTCGIFDHEQWQEGAHCRDYFFVSQACASRITTMSVDTDTAASDHQPLSITLDS